MRSFRLRASHYKVSTLNTFCPFFNLLSQKWIAAAGARTGWLTKAEVSFCRISAPLSTLVARKLCLTSQARRLHLEISNLGFPSLQCSGTDVWFERSAVLQLPIRLKAWYISGATVGPAIHVPYTLLKTEVTSWNSVLWFGIGVDKFLAILTFENSRNFSISISNWSW